MKVTPIDVSAVEDECKVFVPGSRTTRLELDDLFAKYGPPPLEVFDQNGNPVRRVRWVDPVRQEFGQLVTDANDRPQIDPNDPSRAWEITRYGTLTIRKRA